MWTVPPPRMRLRCALSPIRNPETLSLFVQQGTEYYLAGGKKGVPTFFYSFRLSD